MRIPKRFRLYGHVIEVVDEPLLDSRHGNIGEARYTRNEIALQPECVSFSRPDTYREQVFCHELVHWILHEMFENELRSNEKFVDNFASLLHQAFTSMEFEEIPGGEK